MASFAARTLDDFLVYSALNFGRNTKVSKWFVFIFSCIVFIFYAFKVNLPSYMLLEAL